MRLRNKKTGKVHEWLIKDHKDNLIPSLKYMNDKWEDVDEEDKLDLDEIKYLMDLMSFHQNPLNFHRPEITYVEHKTIRDKLNKLYWEIWDQI